MKDGMHFYGEGYYNITEHNYINKYGLYPEKYKDILRATQSYANEWGVTFEDVIEILNSLNETHNLFRFVEVESGTNYYTSARLIAERAGYVTKSEYINGLLTYKKDEYDIYVTENTYAHCALHKCGDHILKKYYSWLYESDVYRPYADLPDGLNEKSSAENLYRAGSLCTLSFGDIKNILDNPTTYKEYEVDRCSYRCYTEDCFIKLCDITVHGTKYEYSLQIPVKAIVNRDWSLVENCKVYSIIKPTANEKLGHDRNNWFDGLQKFSPYWENEKVKEIEKKFKGQN